MEKLSLKLSIKGHLRVECDDQETSRMGECQWLVIKHHLPFWCLLRYSNSELSKAGKLLEIHKP